MTVTQFPKKQHWNLQRIEQAYQRSEMAESVELPADQFRELLDLARKGLKC